MEGETDRYEDVSVEDIGLKDVQVKRTCAGIRAIHFRILKLFLFVITFIISTTAIVLALQPPRENKIVNQLSAELVSPETEVIKLHPRVGEYTEPGTVYLFIQLL